MSFFDAVDEHIEYMLNEGVLPDVEEILEMDATLGMGVEVPGQQLGPQASGPEGGPVSPPGATFPWSGRTWVADRFLGASTGNPIPPAMFSSQPNAIPPAMFSGAAAGGVAEEDEFDEEVVAAVLADLESLRR